MSNIIQERYNPVPLAVNSSVSVPTGSGIGGFLCFTTGTLTIAKSDGTVIINALPVTAGVYYPMPFYLGSNPTVTTAGGASGVLGTS